MRADGCGLWYNSRVLIPKVIHCCWLSGEPKGELAKKCLASWRKFAPEWEVREWDLPSLSPFSPLPPFVRDAVAARKWAFAADWVRFAVLNECGGVYFDYDFELVRPIAELPGGEWCAGQWLPGDRIAPEPAALALERGSPLARAMLDHYAERAFGDKVTVGEVLETMRGGDRGLRIRVLDPEVLSPIGVDGKLRRTERTIGVHWYAMSWADPKRKVLQWMKWHHLEPAVRLLVWMKRRMWG